MNTSLKDKIELIRLRDGFTKATKAIGETVLSGEFKLREEETKNIVNIIRELYKYVEENGMTNFMLLKLKCMQEVIGVADCE